MSDKTTSQAQKKTGPLGFDGVPGFDAVRKMADENWDRTQSMMEEFGRIERSSMEQMNKVIDESARMMHESMNYAIQLHGEWRKASMDAAKRAMDMISARS